MSDQRPNWPPSYAEACTEPLEALRLIIKLTGIDEEGYDRLVALTEEILADPGFQRLQHAIARGVRLCPYLDGVGVLDLARAVGFPVTGSEATDATHETGREASVTPAANGDTPDR